MDRDPTPGDPVLELSDIQGIVLRRYPMPAARHSLLSVEDPVAARAALGAMVGGDEQQAPQVSTAEAPFVPTAPTMSYRLFVGLTWSGLGALGVSDRLPPRSFRSFPAFVAGAAARGESIGETGPNGPEAWLPGFSSDTGHALVSVLAPSTTSREAHSRRVEEHLVASGAFRELWHGDAEALKEPDDHGVEQYVRKAHFGYVDALTEPTVRGGPGPYPDERQEPCDPWLFVLMDEGRNYHVPEPSELGRNGSFAVFRVDEQDVVGFEDFLRSKRDQIDPELLAAKLLGRWRNGVPLALSPDTDSPPGGMCPSRLNDFEYVESDGSGDPWGERTPIGSHIRRMHPRGQPIKGQGIPGGTNNDHRILRRALPYGPTYLPGEPDDGIPRGLMGHFVNSSIENQFEFVLREWVNRSDAVGKVRLDPRSKGAIVGTNSADDSVFDIPQPDGAPPIRVTGFNSFTQTKAMSYLFMPSLTALRFIADLT